MGSNTTYSYVTECYFSEKEEKVGEITSYRDVGPTLFWSHLRMLRAGGGALKVKDVTRCENHQYHTLKDSFVNLMGGSLHMETRSIEYLEKECAEQQQLQAAKNSL